MITNIMLGGVGGQGLVLMTRIISQVALKSDLDVKSNDVVGLSQRGGMVWGSVRFGDNIYSPNIPPKEVDILLAMEPMEALRWSSEIKESGVIILNSKRWYPVPVQQEKADYPEEEINTLKDKYNTIEINAFEDAVKLGKKQVSNVILLGILANKLNLHKEIWKETIADNVPEKTIDLNMEAFEYGYNYVDAK
ncbi:indolepyruvate oxidoreductase subunit beta [Serpentinicella alkaliphila]|uniref:Indolepyruvate ferredoxin oxidoreductase beta subunit n=1 Tax=Serpentinicella alkaliphila TaxID=1734049 RepID=A0A4R2TNS6_9FIRM|nr:indolepyruvate oxidoreductase subunit beta [Serpentinicella alkaliphila]QUH27065.1 indolepyruvate oxidoreductase subunit beta [Serpentinicella alkaliphila]TCQ05191.1 indolepyruvate ferredoxin oxidoreductase beta subunit [Serpentinicella alkaliphila]